jgi:branched-chain amino acid aminotransferase
MHFSRNLSLKVSFLLNKSLKQSTRRNASSATTSIIDVTRLTATRTTSPKPQTPKANLVFGATTSDHMLEIDWDEKKGWHAPVISPYHPLSLDPACNVFHYGIEAFEGTKCYKDARGKLRLFRPELNMKRLAHSMVTLSLPPLDQEGFLACIKKLVEMDKNWVPEGEGFSLYLRPTVIGTQPTLGVTKSKNCKLFTIACPVGPYYPEGFKPVKLLAESQFVRAFHGGTGDSKLGGNYAPTIRVQAAAAQQGYSQVLWLYGPRKLVTEVGTMNFFCFWVNKKGEKELITAPLDGTILPGVTRQSMLDLARRWGEFKVTEAEFSIHEVIEAVKEGRVIECFGGGTAAVVSPIKQISFEGKSFDVPLHPTDPNAGAGVLTKRFWDTLADIQYGRNDHGFPSWSQVIS